MSARTSSSSRHSVICSLSAAPSPPRPPGCRGSRKGLPLLVAPKTSRTRCTSRPRITSTPSWHDMTGYPSTTRNGARQFTRSTCGQARLGERIAEEYAAFLPAVLKYPLQSRQRWHDKDRARFCSCFDGSLCDDARECLYLPIHSGADRHLDQASHSANRAIGCCSLVAHPMIDRCDVWQAALLIAKRYGDDAMLEAAVRAD
jgi:hypothetical protein